MDKQQAKELLDKYNNGTASTEEINLVESWFLHLKSTQADHGLSEEMIDRNTDELWRSLKQQLPNRKVTLWPRIAAAVAVVVVLFSAGLWYFENNKATNSNQLVNDVAPGKNGATLTLSNGQKILINEALAGNFANETGVKISKNKDGQIIYEITDEGTGAVTYNTLSTTRGEQTQVRLPDGTLVFLNSESSLKYPTHFAGSDKRMVSLEGEGFFDVSKDKHHPFIVKTRGQEVEVLGTQFNINSYNDERAIKTTLIEGSVKVTNANSVSKILKPNQQSTVLGKDIKVDNVEAQFFVDWKEGFFMFDNETLESIMNRVSRWYDVKVVYEDGALKKVKASGTVSKFDNISSVLLALEQSDLAKFKLSNGLLTISEKK